MMLPLLVLLLSAPAAPPKKAPPRPAAKKSLLRRAVVVDDATREIPLQVSAGSVTTLSLDKAVATVILPDPKRWFDGEPQAAGQAIFLRPLVDIPPGDALTMQVTLADGTALPPFLITSSAEAADLFVEVQVALQRRASADSSVALKAQVAELQSRLDECQQSAGDKGAAKVAELVLRQDFRKPVAFVVEQHPTRKLDKQSMLLVETRHVYRLFDVTYLVLTVENRDPEKLWVLERAEISVEGASSVEARVLEVAQEMSQGIPSGEEAKLVVAFKTPEQTADHLFQLKLQEKAGNRHVVLAGLRL